MDESRFAFCNAGHYNRADETRRSDIRAELVFMV
jgi:hypothetical protein